MTYPAQDNTPLSHVSELVSGFETAQNGLADNHLYYESRRRPQAVGLATPPKMRDLLAAVGWPRMYINAIEERLDLEGFRLAGKSKADSRLWDWWQANRLDEKAGLGHTEALLHGRAYIVISEPDENDPLLDPTVPVIDVLPPTEMWADIDRRTGKVRRAVRVQRPQATSTYDREQYEWVTVYLPNSTTVYQQSGQNGWTVLSQVQHNLGVVPVVPLLNRTRLIETDGCSEITEELRSVTDSAARVMMNMQATAELMAVPQRILFGVDPEDISDDPTNRKKTFDAYMARILAFDTENGKATQFAAAELRNFTEVLQELAKQAASYTGLPPQYLSFASDNPASAEAIRSAETRLVKKAERKAKVFGEAWEQAMRIAMLLMDGSVPQAAFRMESIWRDPSTPTFAAMSDAVVKLVSTVTSDGKQLYPTVMARRKLGMSEEELAEAEQFDKANPAHQLADLYGQPGAKPRSTSDPNQKGSAPAPANKEGTP